MERSVSSTSSSCGYAVDGTGDEHGNDDEGETPCALKVDDP